MYNFDIYTQSAMTFAAYNNNPLYAYGLLASEAGEVVGKVIKCIRDNNSELTDTVTQGIALELGDVCWAIAAINYHKRWNIHAFPQNLESPIAANCADDLMERCMELSVLSSSLAYELTIEADEPSPSELGHIYAIVHDIANSIQYSMSDICTMNIQKLQSRKDRGTIKGSGDYR